MRLLPLLAAYCLVGFAQSPLLKEKEAVALNPRSSAAHFFLGEAYLDHKNYQAAANEFREVLNAGLAPSWVEVWAHIDLGKIFDITGQCDRAVNEYDLARLTEDDSFGAQYEIQEYLDRNVIRPFTRVPISQAGSDWPAEAHSPGPGVVSPTMQTKLSPQYTDSARAAGLEGTVLLKVVIAEDGTAATVRVARPLGLGLDERAIEAVRKAQFTPGLFQGRPAPVWINVPVDFTLSSRQSRWHLVRVLFQTSEGASPPIFEHVDYPAGSGVASTKIDDARLVNAMGRFAAVSLAFTINEQGLATAFRVDRASDQLWGEEAIAVVQSWRFKPGEKSGNPISVPTRMDLLWGERNLTASPLIALRSLRSDPQRLSHASCRSNLFDHVPR